MAVQTQIQTRRGSAATWTSTNPTLAAGEIGFESDTNKFKIGTGSTAWVSLPYASNVSPLTTKGDLYTYSTDNARLAVGANGETLVADSSTTTGLRYQSAYNGNGVINGGMDIWQRGTSFAFTNPQSTYTADRWLGRHLGTNVTYTQQTSGLTGIQYSLRVQRPNATTGTNAQQIYYLFETADSYCYAGQTITLSFWAKAGANFSATSSLLYGEIYSGTGTNQNITLGAFTGQVQVASQGKTLTTSWQRFSITGTVGATATQIALIFGSTPTGTAGANDWFEITGVQVELGSVATSFKRSGSGGGTIQGELAACQRYYYRLANADNIIGSGVAQSTSLVYVTWQFPVTMRGTPSVAANSGGSYFILYSGGYAGTFAGISTISTVYALRPNGALISWATASITAGSGVIANLNNASAYLEASAEL
jgi:hypothetical protein